MGEIVSINEARINNVGSIGLLGGLCNRQACRTPGADWFNHSTQKYYCCACAIEINRQDELTDSDGADLYGHELCTAAERCAA